MSAYSLEYDFRFHYPVNPYKDPLYYHFLLHLFKFTKVELTGQLRHQSRLRRILLANPIRRRILHYGVSVVRLDPRHAHELYNVIYPLTRQSVEFDKI